MITVEEYRQRRERFAQGMSPNSIAIIPGASEVLRSGDSHYRFRQQSDFYYLTGFEEPDALLIIMATEKPVSILFNRSRDLASEQWTGRRLGQEEAPKKLLVDFAYPIETFEERIPELLADKTMIYYHLGQYPRWDNAVISGWEQVKKLYRKGVTAPQGMLEISPIVSEMRLFKSKAEIALMKQAAAISVAAHKQAMRHCPKAENECELEAVLIYEFTRQGCRYPAYEPIVGSGENATVLHYGSNNQSIDKKGLVLIDAGGEYQNYAADITRTFPASGKFSPEQKAIYEWVLKAQKAGVALIRPGVLWHEIQQTMVQILTEGLVSLGLLTGSVESLITTQAYRKYYMHNSGHWLGIDVHDCGAYKRDNQWRPLQSGMVLTVEPGLYVHPELDDVDDRWRGIGVRIEDDILVTETGHLNLTAELPVEVEEIEALMRG
ncbi:Xaa-Pro aminopeptidase [Legionella sp. W05-934-2]|uniref:Xaa-Pro aminopeptidase n=1 Tax=Legionella sp. W05-934-2 TaxID=1198649 RepID=UPI003463511A